MTLSRREFAMGALLLTVAGCGGSRTEQKGRTLKLGQSLPPVSLDPARSGGESLLYAGAAYDPLIYRAPDGGYQPRLAASWRYLGTGNRAFELTLRQGVKFSDGTPLDAAAVKANLDYFRKAAGQAAAFLAPISAVEATGLTVRISLSAPHPQLPALFTQDYFAGNVISPAALANPGALATRTFGAGPYMLAPGETVANDHYTYVPNPHYWGTRGGYDKVVIRVLPNENTALAALKTAQVDVIAGSYAIVGGAKSAGLRVASTPNVVFGLQLNDRAGKLSKPLGDIRVRQALNHAVDRQKITTALLGEYGVPTDQLAIGARPYYAHDPDRARQLLSDAGHADGFRLPVLIPSTPAFVKDIVQAVAADLKAVGVTLDITAKEPAAAIMELARYPASSLGWGVLPPYFMGRGLWLREAIGMNPFHSTDRELEALDAKAAAAGEAGRAALDEQIVRRVAELGWFLPICLSPVFFLHRDTVNLNEVPGKPLPSLASWQPAS